MRRDPDRLIWAMILFVVVVLGFIMLLSPRKSHGADLPLPKPRPVSEACVTTRQGTLQGTGARKGQILASDSTCPSGWRWRNPR